MKFVLLCPDTFTGGPFATLQLNDSLIRLGYESEILFYDIVKKPFFQYRRRSRKNFHIPKLTSDYFEVKYKKAPDLFLKNLDYKVCTKVYQNDIIVLGEVQIETLIELKNKGFNNCVLWWLSWDNAPLSKINRFEYLSFIKNSINIFQSHYAKNEAKRLGIQGIIVSDYTLYDDKKIKSLFKKTNDICFFPAKARGSEGVINHLKNFFSVIAIENMTQTEVQETLQSSKYFIDFGHHPGKDRIPREAALFDCIPIFRKAGAAGNMKDVGLPDTLKLQIEDMMNHENMVNKIRDIDKNRHHFLQKLEIYKKQILSEAALFDKEVLAFSKLFRANR